MKKTLTVFFLIISMVNSFELIGQCTITGFAFNDDEDTDDESCSDEDISITATIADQDPGSIVYTWHEGAIDGTVVGGNSNVLTQSPDVTSTYFLVVTGTGCDAPSTSDDVTITVYLPPVSPASITGSTDVCQNQSTTYTVTFVSGYDYDWTVSETTAVDNNAEITSDDDNSVTIQWSNDYEGEVIISVDTDVPECDDSDPTELIITLYAPPATPTSSNPDLAVCSNESTSYLVSSDNATSYSWLYFDPGGAISSTSGSATATLQVDWYNLLSTMADVTFNVQGDNPGCPPSIFIEIPVTVYLPLANPTSIVGDSQVCNTEINSYSSNSTNAEYYLWTISNSEAITDTSNSATNNLLVDWNNSFDGLMNGVVVLTVQGDNLGCPASSIAQTAIAVFEPPLTPTCVICPGTVCQNATTTFEVNADFAQSYSWMIDPADAGIITGNGDETISIDWENTFDDTVFISVTADNFGCPESGIFMLDPVEVLSLVAPSVSITSDEEDNEICDGDCVQFSISEISNAGSPSYAWYHNGDLLDNSSSSTLTLCDLLDDYTIQLEIHSGLMCADPQDALSNIIAISVYDYPGVSINPVIDSICSGENVDIELAGTGTTDAISFEWECSDNVNINGCDPGSATDPGSITEQLTNSTNNLDGTVTYIITPSTEHCPGEAQEVSVTVFPLPTVSADDDGMCSGDTSAIPLSASVTSTFTWTVFSPPEIEGALPCDGDPPCGDEIIDTMSNDSSNQLPVTYFITATSTEGCIGEVLELDFIVSPPPATPIILQQPDEVCAGAQNVIFSVGTDSPNTVLWNTSPPGYAIVNIDDSNAFIDFSNGDEVYVIAEITNQYGCTSKDSVLVVPSMNSIEFFPDVVLYEISNTLIVTLNGNQYSYQWGFTDENSVSSLFPGETGQDIILGDDFNSDYLYWVIITDETTGCQSVFIYNEPDATTTHIIESSGNVFSFFPNPASQIISIQLPHHSEAGQLVLLNAQGKVVLQEKLSVGEENVIDISRMADGIYFLTITGLIDAQVLTTHKLIINR